MPFALPAPAVSRTCAGEAGKVGAATVVTGCAGPAEEEDDGVEALAEQPSPTSPIPSHKQRFTGMILSHKKTQVHGFFARPYQKADTRLTKPMHFRRKPCYPSHVCRASSPSPHTATVLMEWPAPPYFLLCWSGSCPAMTANSVTNPAAMGLE